MSVPKHGLIGGWYPRRQIVDHQMNRHSGSNESYRSKRCGFGMTFTIKTRCQI